MTKHKNHSGHHSQKGSHSNTTSSQKRRPGRDPVPAAQVEATEKTTQPEATDAEQLNFDGTHASHEGEATAAQDQHSEAKSSSEADHDSGHSEDVNSHQQETPFSEKTHIEFPYSVEIRVRVPEVFELAEAVIDEWKGDGRFDNLPVGHPIAQFAAGKALRKAKDVEKKLEEKGVFMMARIGIDFVKSKINKK